MSICAAFVSNYRARHVFWRAAIEPFKGMRRAVRSPHTYTMRSGGGGGEDEKEGTPGGKKHTDFLIKVLVMCTRTKKMCLYRTANKALLLRRLSPHIYQPVPGVEQFLLINVPTDNVYTVNCPESHTRSLTLQFLEARCVKRG